MKKAILVRIAALAFIGVLFSGTTWAQDDKSKRASPPVVATGKVRDANITIDYSSPSVKGRKIFGGLVPYGQVWRAGANEATLFSTDKDIFVEGKKLPAGKYSLFATPGEKEWTVFFNTQTGQWGDKEGGAANMDPKATLIEVKVKPKALSEVVEKMNYTLSDKGFSLNWDKVSVPVDIKMHL